MPRFHFNLYDGTESLDPDGEELADIAAARRYALRYFADVLQTDSRAIAGDGELRLDVTDETGLLLVSLHFTTVYAPAVRPPDLTISILPSA